jgi:predicted branched-subunit amino acid permease
MPVTDEPTRRRWDRDAIADAVPLFVPAIPFGFVVGLAVTESEMPTWVAWSTSPVIFAGASQLAVVTLAGVASIWAVMVAALVINSRHVMYGAALATTFRDQPRWFRWVGPFFLIDQVFALVALRQHDDPVDFRRYYLSVAIFFYITWQVVVTAGMIVGPIVPESWRLDVAPAIMFTGLVVFAVTRVPAAVAAVVGALVSLLAVGLRDRLGVIIGAVAGVLAGAVAEALVPSRDDSSAGVAEP